MPDELVKEFRLVDNKTGELAGWDFDLLNDELEAIGHSLEEFGFDADLNDININDFFDTPGSGRHQDRETNSESNADNGEHMQANDVNSKRIDGLVSLLNAFVCYVNHEDEMSRYWR